MFQGRYGNDELNRALMLVCIGIFGVNLLLNVFIPYSFLARALSFVSFVAVAVALYRMFSRNYAARAKENAAFLRFWASLGARFSHAPRAKTARQTPTFAQRRKYKYFICPQCAQRMRVPRGKGNIRVTCTRCSNQFEMKS